MVALLFSRSVKQNPDGSFYLQVAEERAPITVEDTPYVVKSIEGDAPSGFTIVLNDDEHEPLDPATLEVGRDNVLYCRVKGGATRARLLRNAYYHLSPGFEADDHGGFSLSTRGRRYPLLRADAAGRTAGHGKGD